MTPTRNARGGEPGEKVAERLRRFCQAVARATPSAEEAGENIRRVLAQREKKTEIPPQSAQTRKQ